MVEITPVLAPSSHGLPQKGYGAKWAIALPWKLVTRTKLCRKRQANSLIPIIWFSSCNNSLFSGMMLTLHKSQVHCSGVMQWRACNSLTLFAEASCETCKLIVLQLVFICVTTTWQRIF